MKIEMPGSRPSGATISRIMPKDRSPSRLMSQSSVTCCAGASPSSSASITEDGLRVVVSNMRRDLPSLAASDAGVASPLRHRGLTGSMPVTDTCQGSSRRPAPA